MALDGFDAEAERRSDLTRTPAFGDETKNLNLPGRELFERLTDSDRAGN